MRELLQSASIPPYLDETGRIALEQGRRTAGEAGIFTTNILALGPKHSCLLTWSGTRIHRTLAAMMVTLDVHPTDCVIGLEVPMPAAQILTFITKLLETEFLAEHLALAVRDALPISKFDWLVGPELVAIHHARQFMDISSAKAILRSLLPQ